jgi:ceramide glucosyltransferase
VGLTTCLYRGRGYFGLPSVVESLLINTDFIPMVMTGHLLGRRDALGASIAVTRPALDAIGGFGSIADYLADDNLLGVRVREAGYSVVLVPYVVETVLDSVTLADVWRHQLRWARTYRVCFPVGWFFSVVTHAMLWGVLAVVATGGSLVGWAAVATALACRLVSLAGIMRLLREQDTPRQLSLVPLKDIGYSAIWLVSWFSRSVDWSGEQFVIESDGRLTPMPVAQDDVFYGQARSG